MMYRKPSRRWVAIRAAYLLPLSALAVLAFARPQTLSEIEEKVEATAPTVTDVVKTVAQQLPSSPLDLWSLATGWPQAGEGQGPAPTPAADKENTDPIPAWEGNGFAELPDSNLVGADLAESGHFASVQQKSAAELLDSTMQAVGARKIAEGTYLGHFQPSLNSDTVRIARVAILDRQSRQTDEHLFARNAADPCAYNATLNAETRRDRTGYYIRYLQPVSSTVRNYDERPVDPMLLSTDSVLTGRSIRNLTINRPVAIERSKKETRIYIYSRFIGEPNVLDSLLQASVNPYTDYAIVDEQTGDMYVCRGIDWEYYKHVTDEPITLRVDGQSRQDTLRVYQICLVFPALDRKVKEAYFGSVGDRGRYSHTFDLNDIPRKGRVITQ